MFDSIVREVVEEIGVPSSSLVRTSVCLFPSCPWYMLCRFPAYNELSIYCIYIAHDTCWSFGYATVRASFYRYISQGVEREASCFFSSWNAISAQRKFKNCTLVPKTALSQLSSLQFQWYISSRFYLTEMHRRLVSVCCIWMFSFTC